jgi:hypothetical protein
LKIDSAKKRGSLAEACDAARIPAARSKGQANGKSVVQEESIDERMVEERQRNGRARPKYRFGRGKQATNRAYKTDPPILDRRFAVDDEAKASSLNAEHCGEFSLQF